MAETWPFAAGGKTAKTVSEHNVPGKSIVLNEAEATFKMLHMSLFLENLKKFTAMLRGSRDSNTDLLDGPDRYISMTTAWIEG